MDDIKPSAPQQPAEPQSKLAKKEARNSKLLAIYGVILLAVIVFGSIGYILFSIFGGNDEPDVVIYNGTSLFQKESTDNSGSYSFDYPSALNIDDQEGTSVRISSTAEDGALVTIIGGDTVRITEDKDLTDEQQQNIINDSYTSTEGRAALRQLLQQSFGIDAIQLGARESKYGGVYISFKAQTVAEDNETQIPLKGYFFGNVDSKDTNSVVVITHADIFDANYDILEGVASSFNSD